MSSDSREGKRLELEPGAGNKYLVMQSYPARVLDIRLQVNWARDAREGPRVLMSLRSTKFRAFLSSPFIHSLLPPSSYPWPPMVTHLLLEVASPPSLPSPFRCHLSSKKQRNPLMEKILGLQAPMELTSLSTSILLFRQALKSFVFHLLAKPICWLSERPLSATPMG
ncbi:hypothetical protein GmHk_09G025412 [Glycine max]|nr:hypothetical protein GmHk_09G025412 [Glycine max]